MAGTTRVGFAPLNEVRWGTHICQFYRTPDELLECLVPYVATGLERGEKCLWITSRSIPPDLARRTLKERQRDAMSGMRPGQLAIIDHESWSENSGASAEDVADAWLDAESDALAEGYPGLRIIRDTTWLEESNRADFIRFDEQLHRKIQGRDILCLCSYSLAKCGPDQIVDVLRNHNLALVRRGNAWELIGSATSALAATSPLHSHVMRGHSMHLYADRGPLAETLAEWVAEAAKSDDAAILFVTGEMRSLLDWAFAARGVPAQELRKRGTLVMVSAEEVLAGLLVEGNLSADGFERFVASVIRRTAARHPGVRVFGEMVDMLWRERRSAIAIELERMWNRFREEIPFRLLCAYDSTAANSSGEDAGWLARLCQQHDDLQASSGGPFQKGFLPENSRRNVERRAMPTGRIAAEAAAARRLSLLQGVTAALSETITYDDAARVMVGMRDAVGAFQVCLFLRSGEMLQAVGTDAKTRDIPLSDSDPIARAVRSETPIWVPSDAARIPPTACLPLTSPTGCVGALRFTFPEDRELLPEDRAFLLDIARQASMAVQRVRLFENAQAANEKLASASVAKDEFLAMLGHELRNPLSPMLTALELIKLRGDGSFARERETIERQLRHIVSLVDDLFDVSRIAHGKIELCREPVDLAAVINQAVEMTSRLHREKEQQVEVVTTPGVVVDGDPRRLAQIFSNLLSNASRYTPVGGAILVTASSEGETAIIEVRDTGIGMAADVLARIFDPFVQGSRRAAGAEGLGVGLTIVRRLVDLHGGTVRAESPGANRGSTLTVQLPALNQGTAPKAEARPSQTTSHVPRRVLLVDDNFDFVTQMSEAMRTIGHEVQTATDGPTALSVAIASPPDIALLDIGMPFMDGYELANRFQQDARLANIPLVAFTGYGQETDRARTKAVGFREHLVKPVDLEAVATVVDRLAAPPRISARRDTPPPR